MMGVWAIIGLQMLLLAVEIVVIATTGPSVIKVIATLIVTAGLAFAIWQEEVMRSRLPK